MMNRPALYFAAKYHYLGSVKALLAGKAKPGLKDNQGINCIHVCTDDQVSSFLKKGFLL